MILDTGGFLNHQREVRALTMPTIQHRFSLDSERAEC